MSKKILGGLGTKPPEEDLELKKSIFYCGLTHKF